MAGDGGDDAIKRCWHKQCKQRAEGERQGVQEVSATAAATPSIGAHADGHADGHTDGRVMSWSALPLTLSLLQPRGTGWVGWGVCVMAVAGAGAAFVCCCGGGAAGACSALKSARFKVDNEFSGAGAGGGAEGGGGSRASRSGPVEYEKEDIFGLDEFMQVRWRGGREGGRESTAECLWDHLPPSS